MPPLSILVKPASGACNLGCAYCFYADEAGRRAAPDRGRMPPTVSHALIDKAAAQAGEGPVSFLFQGGEPTLVGLDFFQDFVSYAEGAFSRGTMVQYSIQTNGIGVDGAWCRFFKEKRFLVGLSLDGNRECHNRFRLDRAGKGTYDRALRAARLLEQAGVGYNVLTVVTGHLARHAQGVFSALCKSGFRFQQYIPCLSPLAGEWAAPGCALSPGEYGEFLKTLFDLWYRELEQGRYWSIRYFDNLVWMLDGRPPEQCSMTGCCSLQYMIEADGDVYPCDFYGLDEYCLGNICKSSWAELDRARELLGFVQRSQHIPVQCRDCRWYPLCRNGCRRERVPVGVQLGRSCWCGAYSDFFPYAFSRLRRVRDLLRQVKN